MCRLVGGAGDPATHIENRCGEPAANPYRYTGSQIIAGVDGMANRIDPGDPYAQTQKPLLPNSLEEAVNALSASAMYRATLGNEFIEHYIAVRRHEIGRYQRYADSGASRKPLVTLTCSLGQRERGMQRPLGGMFLRGVSFTLGEPGYDAARIVFNRIVDRRPALIARCAGAADVIACVGFAHEHNLAVSVRGGGHSIAGKAI